MNSVDPPRTDQAVRHRRKLRNRLIVAAFFLVIALVALLESPLTRVRQIVVTGNRTVSSQRILAEAGITSGMSLWQVNALATRTAIMKQEPMVGQVQVHVQYLHGLITLNITEKSVVAVLSSGGQFYRLLSDGTVFGQTTAAAGTAVPIVTLSRPLQIQLHKVVPDATVVSLCKQLVGVSSQALAQVSEFHVEPFQQVTVFLTTGFEARINSDDVFTMLPKVYQAMQYFSEKGYAPGIVDMTSLPYRYTPFVAAK